jgi:hypothetical protein
MTDTDKCEPDFYDCRDREKLTWEDRDEAIEEHLDYLGVMHSGMTEAEVLDALPETITVKGYARMPVTSPDHLADTVLERFIEDLDEEYGDSDQGPSEATPAVNFTALKGGACP